MTFVVLMLVGGMRFQCLAIRQTRISRTLTLALQVERLEGGGRGGGFPPPPRSF